MTPLQPSADNLAAVNSDAPEVAADLDDRLRAAYVKAHDAEEAWLESTGHLYDPSLPIDAGIRAVLREAQAHPSRGVVDEGAGVRDTLVVAAHNPSSHGGLRGLREIMLKQAARLDAALQAAALPAVPSDWVMVPRVPTEPMVWEFCAERPATTYLTHTTLQCADFASRYAAMLAATPAQEAR